MTNELNNMVLFNLFRARDRWLLKFAGFDAPAFYESVRAAEATARAYRRSRGNPCPRRPVVPLTFWDGDKNG